MYGFCTPAFAPTSSNRQVSIDFPPRLMYSRFGPPNTETKRSGSPSLLTSPHATPLTNASRSMPTLCETSVNVPSRLLRYNAERCESNTRPVPVSLTTDRHNQQYMHIVA